MIRLLSGVSASAEEEEVVVLNKQNIIKNDAPRLTALLADSTTDETRWLEPLLLHVPPTQAYIYGWW